MSIQASAMMKQGRRSMTGYHTLCSPSYGALGGENATYSWHC